MLDRTTLTAVFVALVSGAGSAFAEGNVRIEPSSTTAGLRCPGDNPAYFDEIQENGWVGFGETWDFDVCDDGVAIYAEGANRRWRAMRPKLANRPTMPPSPIDAADILFYSTALPYGAFGTLGLVFVIAWIVSLLQRKKQAPTVVVTCTGCHRGVPVRPEEGGVFCPACGTVALVDIAAGNPPA
jgi:predicted RNA-binding Zn-ribbon protein involved in translation (DUF1610 family)